ncbi:MAG: IPT/TIG domain-containing protein [Prevotellaceae bacterium]|jgi:hypothetical protein|nr:IPT/TIG domain-containing protein [Prevotellaceae bacterium]
MEITEVTLLDGRTPARGSVAGGTGIIIRGNNLMYNNVYSDGINTYHEIERLTFSGGQSINSMISLNLQSQKYKIKYKFGNDALTINSQITVFGSDSPISSEDFGLRKGSIISSINYIQLLIGSSLYQFIPAVILDNLPHIFDWNLTSQNKGTLDNIYQTKAITTEIISNYPIILGIQSGYFRGDIYSFKIWNFDELVRDMIPVINIATNKGGMWDKVSGTFFGNNGAGQILPNQTINVMIDIAGTPTHCTDIAAINNNTIICNVPIHNAGNYSITVDNGVENTTMNNAFEYVPCLAQKTANGYNPLKMKHAGGDWDILLKQ